MSDSKIILTQNSFQEILDFTTPNEITTFFEGKEFIPKYNTILDRITCIKFDDRFEFNFSKLKIENLSINIEIDNNKHFEEILINNNNNNNNNNDEYILIKLNNISSKSLVITQNSNIDIVIEDSVINNIGFENNRNSRRIALTNVKIENTFVISNSDLQFTYIEKCVFNDLELNKVIQYDDIIIKESSFEKFILRENSEIESIKLTDVNCERISFNDSSILTIVIKKTEIIDIIFSGVKDLFEITLAENSDVQNCNFYSCLINNFLIQDESKIKYAGIQKKTSINALVATDNCTISIIEFIDSIASTLIFHRGIKINYFYGDDKSKIGNLDILDGSIKSLVLSFQTNSYTFQSTEIGLLKLDDCKINSLNIKNGCKIEAYVTNCIINKIDFKQNNILKDTLISFSECKVYSVIMENFSVVGNLYFRALKPLNKIHNDEWFDVDKYNTSFRTTYDSQNQIEDKDLKEFILQEIKKKGEKWVHKISKSESEIKNNLIYKNYYENKINAQLALIIIDFVKEAFVNNKTEYQKKLIREIKKYNENIKRHRYFTDVEKSNYDFNFNIIGFIWEIIENIHTQDLEFQNIHRPTFRVYQSSLGKAEFSNCDLSNFELQYNSSNFYDCLFLGTEIPEDKLTILDNGIKPIKIHDLNIDKIQFFKQKSEFYNQFKKIFEKQGNTFNAGVYNSKWAENQEKLLLLSIGKDENFLKARTDFRSFLKSFSLLLIKQNIAVRQDIFTFNLNRISNKHGESWIKTIGFILAPIFILFIFYVTSIYYDLITISDFQDDNITLVWNRDVFDEYFFHLKDFFSFLNPARRLDFFKPIKGLGYISFTSNLIDFITRIILAFGIYQLIAAFRKNAKKN